MRICFFGDSFVNGVGDPSALGWTGRVVAAARGRGLDITAYDLGIRRDTSADIAARWRAEADRRLPPDTPARLLFGFGANDACPGPDGGLRVPVAQTLVTAEAILTDAARRAPTLMIGPIPVLDDPAIDARIAALSADLAHLCRRLAVPFVPVFDVVSTCEPWRREAATGDGTHPGAEGYAALAEALWATPGFRTWLHPDLG